METLICSIDVWIIYLAAHRTNTEQYRDLLTSEELERASKLLNPINAKQFILSRGSLRQILANRLNTDPTALRFTRNAQGKPLLENGELDFNVSHSRDWLLIAVTAGRAVGIDIEVHRDGLNMNAIARRCFSPEEQAYLQTLDTPKTGFFEIWSKKEAYVKAQGTGIYREDLKTISVPMDGAKGIPEYGKHKQWFFQTLEIDPAYTAAIVSEVPALPVYLRKYDLWE